MRVNWKFSGTNGLPSDLDQKYSTFSVPTSWNGHYHSICTKFPLPLLVLTNFLLHQARFLDLPEIASCLPAWNKAFPFNMEKFRPKILAKWIVPLRARKLIFNIFMLDQTGLCVQNIHQQFNITSNHKGLFYHGTLVVLILCIHQEICIPYHNDKSPELKEHAAPILNQCHSYFIDQFIFRLLLPTKI